MPDYRIVEDIEIVKELLGMTSGEIADEIGVSRMTLNNWKNDAGRIRRINLTSFYSMAFRKGIRLNKIKEQLYREDYSDEFHKILFHGAKTSLEGRPDIGRSRKNNDFGQGFYCGESLEQSAMFVSNFPESSLYMIRFDKRGLKSKKFTVDREWMLSIAYFRGRLKAFEGTAALTELIAGMNGLDYVTAPIADNRMFEIIDSFIAGEITDIQCGHCLSATNLGNQYVFLTEKALDQVHILEHCYLAPEEKEYYLRSGKEFMDVNLDKVKIARRQYRGQGQYIEDILK